MAGFIPGATSGMRNYVTQEKVAPEILRAGANEVSIALSRGATNAAGHHPALTGLTLPVVYA